MAICNFYEGLETQRISGPKLRRLFSQCKDANHGRHNISANGGIEELQSVVDTLIDPPATGHAGIGLITAEASVGRDYVLTHLLSSMVEDQNPVTGLRILLDRSSPLEMPPSECLIAPTSTESKHELKMYQPEKGLNTNIKTRTAYQE